MSADGHHLIDLARMSPLKVWLRFLATSQLQHAAAPRHSQWPPANAAFRDRSAKAWVRFRTFFGPLSITRRSSLNCLCDPCKHLLLIREALRIWLARGATSFVHHPFYHSNAVQRTLMKSYIRSWHSMVAALVFLACCVTEMSCMRSIPAANALVGQTEMQIRHRYGEPSRDFSGHFGAPPENWTKQFAGEIRSLVFDQANGQLYITFEHRNGQWIVISNDYLRRGSAF